MSNIVNFGGITSVPEPPAQFLDKAKDWAMDRCIVLGWGENGELFAGASYSDLADIILLLRAVEHALMSANPREWAKLPR